MTALRRHRLAIAVAGVAVIVTAAFGVLGFLRREPDRQSFDAAVAQIMAFVERERGLRFTTTPTIVVAGQDGLARRVRAAESTNQDLAKESDLHLTLGILPPDVDMVEQLHALQSVSVQAKFDDETREVVLKNTSLTPYARTTLAHEVTHALDDQHFGLHRPAVARARDGSGFGLRALGEGNARRVEFAYVATLTEAEQQEEYAERTRLGAHSASADVHPYLGLHVHAPYEYGPPLVAAILDHGGQPALDDAFRSPPTTHEQVLFPKRYLDREQPRTVAAPDADGPVTDTGVVGAFKLGVMFGGGPGQAAAARWGGDRYVVWHEDAGKRACLRRGWWVTRPRTRRSSPRPCDSGRASSRTRRRGRSMDRSSSRRARSGTRDPRGPPRSRTGPQWTARARRWPDPAPRRSPSPAPATAP